MIKFLQKLFGGGVDIKEKLAEGAIVIDVRTAGEFGSGHVKGSKNIPLNKISSKIDQIKKWDKPIVTCCASGIRSGSAKSILKNHGIEVYNGGSWSSVNRKI